MPSVQLGGTQRPAVQIPDTQSVPTRHTLVSAQRAQSVPPQSTSDSVPFRTVSVQLAATQALAAQIRLTQSVVATQRLPLAHDEHVAPPQSMSVSSAFILTSVHDVQSPAVQRLPAQSVAAAQRLPSAHLAQVEVAPPQSTSASPPFCTLSTHEMHTPPSQRAFRQSAAARQILPSPHLAHSVPPQSTSTSSPFLIKSRHDEQRPVSQRPPVQSVGGRARLAVGALRTGRPAAVGVGLALVLDAVGAGRRRALPRQAGVADAVGVGEAGLAREAGRTAAAAVDVGLHAVHDARWCSCRRRTCPPAHICVWQSAGTVQFVPTGQPGQSPPQSTPVSLPFSTRSVQVGPGMSNPRPASSVPIGTSVPDGMSILMSALRSGRTSRPPSAAPPPPPQPARATSKKADPIFNRSMKFLPTVVRDVRPRL